MTSYRTLRLGTRVSLLAITWAACGWSAPALRKQVDQNGDFVLFGNTLGWDCGPGVPSPLVGTANCTGVQNGTTADSAIDVYWASDQPGAGQAQASTATTMANARSTAMLVLPTGASITYARLYWAAYQSGNVAADTAALIERPGTTYTQAVTADDSWTALVPGTTNESWYQSTADITSLLVSAGAGAFRVSGVSSYNNLSTYNDEYTMAGWAVVVFYQHDGDTPRNLALFDGFDRVGPGVSVSTTLSGFLVPQSGFTAKLGVLAYEGDDQSTGDQFSFNGTALSDALNPVNNFFNGTYSNLGVAASQVGDLPRLAGTARSMGGIDIDVVNVTAQVKKGDTSATVGASSTEDRYVLGAFVTSISTFKPDFTTSGKTVSKVASGPLLPGSELKYTVTITNTGNDASINTVMTDVMPPQVTYVPGSLALVSPASATFVAAYSNSTSTLTVRLGTGATATQGGSMAVGETITLSFLVTLNADASGTIENQAIITADGKLGAPTGTFPTDGNGADNGTPPTVTVVDKCGTDTDCASPTPYCNTSASPHVCVGCITSAQCTSATAPECNATTQVCECPGGEAACVDSDGDGLTDLTEIAIGTNPHDADSDDDGVPDGSEINPGEDSDGDGLINALDPDSDNDGLFDGTEMGFGCSNPDTDLAAKRCIPDADLGVTKTNPTKWDTDDGGVSDGSEDSNLNGMVDPGETDPNLGSDDSTVVDTDKDGLSDALEATLHSNPNDRDSDDDGVVDGAEANPSDDVDRDGLIDVLDPDSDNDGLFDGTEMGLGCSDPGTNVSAGHCIADADGGQTRTFALVADTDHGGMLDGTEDRNHDGRVDADERNPNYAADDTAQCFADAECGTITSGFVCDSTHVCIAGCRGTNGNGCPDGQQCSSSNETIGTCSVVGGLGGASSIGSTPSTGGISSLGGAPATGGDSSLGGALATGGDSSLGGAPATGGDSSLGGARATGGGSSLGGALAIGGATATGGARANGGAAVTGGARATGGDSSLGGALATGGIAATGGAESDASVPTGGSGTTVGQSTTVSTLETSVGAQNTNTSIEGGGCSCGVVGSRHPTGTWLTLIAGGLLFWRRRRAH